MLKVDDAVEFIRSKELLNEWSNDQIKKEIQNAIGQNAFTFHVSQFGDIDGIVIGKWKEYGKVLHIVTISGDLDLFVDHLKRHFPDCKTLTAERYGRQIEYTVGENL